MSISKAMSQEEAKTIAKIGLNVAYYRKLALMTQEELAEKACVHQNTLSTYEAATQFTNPTTLTMIRIADALKIPLHYLYDFKPDIID